LSYFYQQPDSELVLFKGGTALRIIYKSPRFSEDLDFSGFGISLREIENLILHTLKETETLGIQVRILESKKTSGGYLGIISYSFLDYDARVIVEISLRKKKAKAESALIDNDFIPAYTISHLALGDLVEEKITAALSRKKPRDFFDVYFILRANLMKVSARSRLKAVLEVLKKEKIDFKKELKFFLPQTHQRLIKDFEKILEREIKRFTA